MYKIVLILLVAVLGVDAHAADSRSISQTGGAQIQSNASQQNSGALRNNNTNKNTVAPSTSQFAVPGGGDAEKRGAGKRCRAQGGFYNVFTKMCTITTRQGGYD